MMKLIVLPQLIIDLHRVAARMTKQTIVDDGAHVSSQMLIFLNYVGHRATIWITKVNI